MNDADRETLEALRYDGQGLIAAVAQDRLTGEIRMVAWMNRAAVEQTLRSGRATFFSRSRGELWEKGATSGHTLRVSSVHVDCDRDTLVLLVEPAGPSCHTGRATCFIEVLEADGALRPSPHHPVAFLQHLEREIESRASAATAASSYTRTLLDAGAGKIGDKVREEAGELAVALADESPERVASEAADVLYHVLVGLRHRGVSLRQVIEVLASRAGTSGHEEKATRTPTG